MLRHDLRTFDPIILAVLVAQAAPTSFDGSDLFRTFLTAGVAGAVVLGAIFGFIFFKPERSQLLATIEELRATSDKYVDIHHQTTVPTLTKALALFETVVTTLTALTKAWEDQARSNADVARRLESLERLLHSQERNR